MSRKKFNTGSQVAFRLGDVKCPDFEQMIAQAGPELSVTGEIVMLSDGGGETEHFAIVHVPGIHVQLIITVDRLESIVGSSKTEWPLKTKAPHA